MPTETGTPIKYASFGRRLCANGLDGILVSIISFLLLLLLGRNIFSPTQHTLSQLAINQLISMLIPTLYLVFLWVNMNGQTLGKKVFGIRIVSLDGKPISYPKAIIRWFGYVISTIPLFLGFLWMLWDKEKQTWHDKMAGTKVMQVDDRPKIIQGIIVLILFVIFYIGLMTYGFYTGFKQASGDRSLNTFLKNEAPGLAIKDYKENMAPEAKIHFERYQTLLEQAKTISTNQSLPLEEREKRIRPIADEFIGELKTAAEIDPNNPVIWAELGNAYTWPNTVGEKESSLEAYRRASQLEPNITVYINYVGDALFALGRYEEAIQEFERSLGISENSGFAHLILGKAYSKVGKHELARQHLERAIEIFLAENKNKQYDDEIIEARKVLNSLPQ